MKNICKEFAATGRCRRKDACTQEHSREVVIEQEKCSLCTETAQCVTVCKHFFCYRCARGFIQQCTKCVICQEETNGVVFITVHERDRKTE